MFPLKVLSSLCLIVPFVRADVYSRSQSDCEHDWYQYGKKCYYFMGHEPAFTFEEAGYECRKHHKAQLVTIKNEEEQAFIENVFKDIVLFNNVWLGAKWKGDPVSDFVWNDNSPVRFKDRLRAIDPKKNKTSLCLSMVVIPENFGTWSAYDCNYYFAVMCERDIVKSAGSLIRLSFVSLSLMASLLVFG